MKSVTVLQVFRLIPTETGMTVTDTPLDTYGNKCDNITSVPSNTYRNRCDTVTDAPLDTYSDK